MPTKRLIDLFAVLVYDTDTVKLKKKGFLTEGFRICINQERAQLMSGNENYIQPLEVENKIQFILKQMTETNTSKPYRQHCRNQLKNDDL